MDKNYIEEYLRKLGFALTDGKTDHWFLTINKYSLYVVLEGSEKKDWEINYGSEIIVHRKTTSNFSQDENLDISRNPRPVDVVMWGRLSRPRMG